MICQTIWQQWWKTFSNIMKVRCWAVSKCEEQYLFRGYHFPKKINILEFQKWTTKAFNFVVQLDNNFFPACTLYWQSFLKGWMTSIALYVIQYGTIGGCNAHEICFQLHKSSALWDMKNILVIDRERGGTSWSSTMWTWRTSWSSKGGHEEHPGHRQGAWRDVGDVRLAERRTEEGTTVRTLRLCALNGARARPPTDRAPVRAHRALRAATKVSHHRDSLLRNTTLLF